jgi:transcriptional regulator
MLRMYVPATFREDRTDVLASFAEAHPFAALVVQTEEGLSINHLPLLLVSGVTLQGHIALGNPLWREARTARRAVAVFQGPHGYISPSWYPTRAETGEVVPTWNYVAVHAHGHLRFVRDPSWLRTHVQALTQRHESARAAPWEPSEAPADFIDDLLKGIVGVELTVDRWEGKWKVGQNRTQAERLGAIAGLRKRGTEADNALADAMEGARVSPK